MASTTLLVAIFLLVNGCILCDQALPTPPSNFVASLSQAQSWDLAASMFTIYSLQGVGYRMDLPLYQTTIFYDIKNQVTAEMNQTDFSCVISPWPQADEFWSFIKPDNAVLVSKMPMNVTFWQFTNGMVSPNEGWVFNGNTPVSGTALASSLWTFTSFTEQSVPLQWLRLPCTKFRHTDIVSNPLLQRK